MQSREVEETGHAIVFTILVVFFVITGLVVAGYFIGKQAVAPNSQFGHPAIPTQVIIPTSTPVVVSSAPSLSPSDVANQYYTAYMNCFQNPPKQAANQPMYCQNSTGLTTADFPSHVVPNRGADPVLCAQNIPLGAKASNESIQGNSATVTVIETFGYATQVRPFVTLQQVNKQWLISNISCGTH